MTSRQAGITAVCLAALMQLGFVVAYYGLAGGAAITSSAADPSPVLLRVLQVISFPGNAVSADLYPEAVRGIMAVLLVNLLFWSLAIYVVLWLGRFCGRLLNRDLRSAAA